MRKTYAGILIRDRIEWTGHGPQDLPADQAVKVRVTILDASAGEPPSVEQGRKMREALEALAREGGLPGNPDGVTWQRKVRRDRRLPGRNA